MANGALDQLSDEQLNQLIASGQAPQAPADPLDELTDEQLDELLTSPDSPSTANSFEDLDENALKALLSGASAGAEQIPPESFPDPAGAAQAGIESFGKAASFGALPFAQAGVSKAGQFLPDSDVDQELIEQGFTLPEGKDFSQLVAENIARQEQQSEQFPIASGVGTVGGLVSGGGALGAGLRAGGRALLPRIAAKIGAGTGLAGRTAATGLESAGIGGVAGISEGDVGGEALAGGAFGAAFPLAGGAIRGSGKVGKSLLSAGLGVRPEVATKFIANGERIRRTPSFEVIKDQAQKAVDDVTQLSSTEQLNLVDEIQKARGAFKAKIIQESELAFDSLKDGTKLDKKVITGAIKQANDKLGIGAFGPLSQASKGAQQNLKNFSKTMDVLPDEIDAQLARKLVKQIREDIDAFAPANQFASDTPSQQSLKLIQREINESLKVGNPAFATKVKEVENLVQFQKEADILFGGKDAQQSTLSTLSRLGKPNSIIKDARFKELSKQMSFNPEAFRKAQENAALFKGFQGSGTESKIKALMGDRNIEIKRTFQKLDDISDNKFVELIDDLSVNTALEQEFLRGSRNVNLWSIMGASAGFGLGGGFVGGAAGAAMGGLVDKFGPKMAKQILIGVGNIKGAPTVTKIRNAMPNKKTADFMIDQFRRGILANKVDEPKTNVPQASRLEIRQMVQSSDHLTPVEKARAITSLNKKGDIDSEVFKKTFEEGEKYITPPARLNEKSRKQSTPPTIGDVNNFQKFKRAKEF